MCVCCVLVKRAPRRELCHISSASQSIGGSVKPSRLSQGHISVPCLQLMHLGHQWNIFTQILHTFTLSSTKSGLTKIRKRRQAALKDSMESIEADMATVVERPRLKRKAPARQPAKRSPKPPKCVFSSLQPSKINKKQQVS